MTTKKPKKDSKTAGKPAPKIEHRTVASGRKAGAAPKRAAAAPAARGEPEVKKKATVARLTAVQKRLFRDMLISLRERLATQIAALKGDSLERHDSTNIEEDGTDAFERQFALSLASSEQDALFEVDEALRRLAEGNYGVCGQCDGLIEENRLKALPFVRTCIKCQSEMEGTRGRFRPRPVMAD